MLVNTISFEIRDFTTNSFTEYCVLATEDNYAAIAQQRFTRNIQIGQMFDFEYSRKQHAPKFVLFANALILAFENEDNLLDIDDVDEMVGTF